MSCTSLRSNRQTASFRPDLESLSERIVPANPHFVSASSTVDTSTGALTVSFKEAGMGNNEAADITVSGDANAVYQWFNKGGNKPQGVPFNVNETFAVSDTFFSDKNGNITGSLTVNPPSVDEFLSTNHAANWVPVLKVSYTDVVVTDTTNGVSTAGDFNLDQSVVFTV